MKRTWVQKDGNITGVTFLPQEGRFIIWRRSSLVASSKESTDLFFLKLILNAQHLPCVWTSLHSMCLILRWCIGWWPGSNPMHFFLKVQWIPGCFILLLQISIGLQAKLMNGLVGSFAHIFWYTTRMQNTSEMPPLVCEGIYVLVQAPAGPDSVLVNISKLPRHLVLIK